MVQYASRRPWCLQYMRERTALGGRGAVVVPPTLPLRRHTCAPIVSGVCGGGTSTVRVGHLGGASFLGWVRLLPWSVASWGRHLYHLWFTTPYIVRSREGHHPPRCVTRASTSPKPSTNTGRRGPSTSLRVTDYIASTCMVALGGAMPNTGFWGWVLHVPPFPPAQSEGLILAVPWGNPAVDLYN
jgi:hypothetical protein